MPQKGTLKLAKKYKKNIKVHLKCLKNRQKCLNNLENG